MMDNKINPNEDGIIHINIYSQGKTELGRMLTNFYHYKVITDDGEFESVEGYWHWLGIADCKEKEVLRTLYGYQAKKVGTQLKKEFSWRNDEDFEHKILKAIWYKVRRHSYMFDSDIANLPLEHYYNFHGNIVNMKDKYIWMIDGIDKMRNTILKVRSKKL